MERHQVDSSVMRAAGYDRERRILQIDFNTGNVYDYFDVPERVFKELLAAESKGSYFNTAIKGAFRFAQVSRRR